MLECAGCQVRGHTQPIDIGIAINLDPAVEWGEILTALTNVVGSLDMSRHGMRFCGSVLILHLRGEVLL